MNQMRTPTPVHVREPILAKRNSVREKGMLGDGDQTCSQRERLTREKKVTAASNYEVQQLVWLFFHTKNPFDQSTGCQ